MLYLLKILTWAFNPLTRNLFRSDFCNHMWCSTAIWRYIVVRAFFITESSPSVGKITQQSNKSFFPTKRGAAPGILCSKSKWPQLNRQEGRTNRMTMFYRFTLENKLQNVRPDDIEGDVVRVDGWMVLFAGLLCYQVSSRREGYVLLTFCLQPEFRTNTSKS